MCAGYLIFLYVPMYATEARVFIRNIPRDNVVAEYGGGQSVATESGYSNPLFNYQQILGSERLASTVYEQYRKRYPDDLKTLGAYEHVDFLDAYTTMVTSKVLPSTDVLKVSFKWPNKAHAPQAALMLVDGFKRVNLEIQQGISSKQNQNLSRQVEDITKELTQVREALKAFRIQNHTVDLDREMEALTDTRVNMERELEVTKADMAFNARKAYEFRRMLNLKPGQSVLAATSVGIDPLLVEVNQRLAEANQRLGKLKSTFTEAYPEVRSVQSEIASLNQTIQKRHQEVLGKQKLGNTPRGIYDGPSSTIAVQLAQA
jgi:capsule polysaccharide export protein KpsE/RkpR